MRSEIGDTHDPKLTSWLESANLPQADFPIQNLPFGVFRTAGPDPPVVGVAIGDRILDLCGCRQAGLLDRLPPPAIRACAAPSLNALMALGREHLAAVRKRISQLLRAGRPDSRESRRRVEPFLVPMPEAVMQAPAQIGNYTDFYASIDHAINVGRLFRPDSPLLPNYKYVPVGYHGRASSIVMSGAAVRRPSGQMKDADSDTPRFAPSRSLDYEVEVGMFVGPANPLGEPVPIGEAEARIFGLCLVNDWSARDVQAWEYQPLGPFLSKSFATSISPWVVTLEALEPFRVPALPRPEGDPPPLPHLLSPQDQDRGAFDLTLEVWLTSARMRAAKAGPLRLSRGNLRNLYWTLAQLLAHHTSNGCNLCPGDLLASGTVSGPSDEARGCLLELTRRGADPIRLPTGEMRAFLEDGDEIVIRGYCEREGFARVGFGECRGVVRPARATSGG